MIPELSIVRTLVDCKDGFDGRPVTAGTEGTVVAIWAKGAAYEVEFPDPEMEGGGILCTLEAAQIELIEAGA